jgi:hypothetical protein
MYKHRRRFIIAGITSLFLLLLCLLGFQESAAVGEAKQAEFCRHLAEKVAFALFQHADHEGQFPDTLESLKKNGLAAQYCGCPRGDRQPYTYVSGLRRDMPENLPLLIELHAPHIFYASDGRIIPYGLVLYLDGTIIPTARELLPEIMEQTRRALAIMRKSEPGQALDIIASPSRHSYLMQAAALWRLRQEKDMFFLPTVREYVAMLGKNRALGMPYQGDIQCAGRQAAYLLWRGDREAALPELVNDMKSYQYFIRKRAWHTVFPEIPAPLPAYAFISMEIPKEAVNFLRSK